MGKRNQSTGPPMWCGRDRIVTKISWVEWVRFFILTFFDGDGSRSLDPQFTYTIDRCWEKFLSIASNLLEGAKKRT